MGTALRNALFASILLHAAGAAPLYNAAVPARNASLTEKLTVDYVVAPEPQQEGPLIAARKMTEAATAKAEVKSKADGPDLSVARIARGGTGSKVTAELAGKQARIRSTKVYKSYYEAIRDKIRAPLALKYKGYRAEGEVYLEFILNADGSLGPHKADRILSVNDQKLIDIALASLKDAAPFPPFPKALSLQSMEFTVKVVFKRGH